MIEYVEISSAAVAQLSSVHYCRNCGKCNDVELAFIALTVAETPDLFTTLSDADRQNITSIEQARDISRRLDISNPQAPSLTCEKCGKQSYIQVRLESHTVKVPAFLWCRCGQEVDLRYPGDSHRVRFTKQFPHVPFLHCRGCKQKLFVPIYGMDAWRSFLFRAIRLLWWGGKC